MSAVSVVIPSYRGGRYLREGVDSVLTQTLEDWELVIVADGNDEDLSDIESKDQRVRVFRQRQRGASIARNVGISLAKSDLIAFLDDDDRMLPDRLLAQTEAMNDRSIGLCHTQCRIIDERGAILGPGLAREVQYGDFLRTDGAIVLSSTMIRKSIILEIGGFNPLLPIGEDLDLIYRIARESRLCFLPEVLVEYRIHDDNSWANSSISSGEEIRLILAQHRLKAMAQGESANLLAIREGMKYVLPGRAQFALQRAGAARARRNYPELLFALGQALVIAPMVVVRVLARGFRKAKRADVRVENPERTV
jgi:glycosyltransferase involved in cell wall biosynthesis